MPGTLAAQTGTEGPGAAAARCTGRPRTPARRLLRLSHVRGRTHGSQGRGTVPEADSLRHAPAGGRGHCARPWHRHQAAPSQKSHVRAPQGAHAAAQTRRAKGLCSRGSEGHLRRRPLGGASGLITRAGPLSVTAPGSREWHPARDIPPCVPSWVFAGLGWSFGLRVSLGCWRFSVQLFLQSAEEA